MKIKKKPTTAENVNGRLFLRFFLCYFATAIISVLLLRRGVPFPLLSSWRVEFFLIPAVLFAGLLTVSKPYLFLLTLAKGFFDMALILRMVLLVQTDSLSLILWNVGLLLLFMSVLLFCFAASRACWFSFCNTARDFHLLFSRAFLHFLVEAVILTALALPLLLLLPKLFVI